MQIRERNRRFVLLRSEYVPEKKRSIARHVGSFEMYHRKVPENLSEKLTEEEKKEVQSFLDKRANELAEASKRMALRNLPDRLKDATQAIEEMQENDFTLERPGYERELVEALSELKKALRKKGIKLTKKQNT
tara:strand:+ start:44 stop:442 length:399 start_codon:yes stop_codon:yes gene_type:complete